MKTNAHGRSLISFLLEEYEPSASRTTAERHLSQTLTAPVTSNQYSAMVCLIMVIGLRDFKKTGFVRMVNSAYANEKVSQAHAAADIFDMLISEENDDFLKEQYRITKELFLKPEEVRKRKAKHGS